MKQEGLAVGEVTGIHRKIDSLSSTMNKKINSVGNDVTYMRGSLDATLPLLARTEQVKELINDHKTTCRRSLAPKKPIDWPKLLKVIGIGLGALAAAIYAFVEFFTSKNPL